MSDADAWTVMCGSCEIDHDQVACPNCGERADATGEVGWTAAWDGLGYDPLTGGQPEVGRGVP